MIGRDTFSVLAPVLGPQQKNWPCYPLPLLLAVSIVPNTGYVTFELLLHAAFVADESWSDTLEPARNPDLLANFSDCCVMTSLCALLTVLSKLGRVLYPAAG